MLCDKLLMTFNKHAPCMKEHPKGNQMPFLHKELSKAKIARIQFRNTFLQIRSMEKKQLFTKQRKFFPLI